MTHLCESKAKLVQGEGPAANLPQDHRGTLLCADRFDEAGMLRIKGRRFARILEQPVRSLFWAAGFSFSSASLLLEVCLQLQEMLILSQKPRVLLQMMLCKLVQCAVKSDHSIRHEQKACFWPRYGMSYFITSSGLLPDAFQSSYAPVLWLLTILLR